MIKDFNPRVALSCTKHFCNKMDTLFCSLEIENLEMIEDNIERDVQIHMDLTNF